MNTWGTSWGSPSAWGDSWGIGITVEDGIGLSPVRPPTVDFVFSNGWYSRSLVLPKASYPQHRHLFRAEKQRAVAQDNGELREMMEMYSRWRQAA